MHRVYNTPGLLEDLVFQVFVFSYYSVYCTLSGIIYIHFSVRILKHPNFSVRILKLPNKPQEGF